MKSEQSVQSTKNLAYSEVDSKRSTSSPQFKQPSHPNSEAENKHAANLSSSDQKIDLQMHFQKNKQLSKKEKESNDEDDVNSSLNDLDVQLQQLQMEIIQNQYKHLDYNDQMDSVREFRLQRSSEKKSSMSSSRDLIFSFRNEQEQSHRNNDGNQSSSNDSKMNFLKDVTLVHSSIPSSNMVSGSMPSHSEPSINSASRQSSPYKDQPLQMIQEDMREHLFTETQNNLKNLNDPDRVQQIIDQSFEDQKSTQEKVNTQAGQVMLRALSNESKDADINNNTGNKVSQFDYDQVHKVWNNIITGSENYKDEAQNQNQIFKRPLVQPKPQMQEEEQIEPQVYSNPGSAPMSSRSTQDYIKVFEQLFQKALETQSNFSLYLEQQDSVPFIVTGLTIDTHNTKSFKDLCVKLVEQIKAFSEGYMNCHQELTKSKYNNEEQCLKLNNQKAQIQELYESQAQESELQDQMTETRMGELKAKYSQQMQSVKNLQQNQLDNFQELIDSQKGQIDKHQTENRKLQEQLAKATAVKDSPAFASRVNAQFEKDNLGKMNQLLNQKVKILAKELDRLKEDTKEAAEAQLQSQRSNASKRSKSTDKDWKLKINQLTQQLDQVKSEKQELNNQISQQKQMLDNLNVMYSLQQQSQENKVGVTQDLQQQYQDQIKENLLLDSRYKHKIELLNIELSEKQNQVDTLKRQIEHKTSDGRADLQELRSKFQRSSQEHSQLNVDLQEDIDKLESERARLLSQVERQADDLVAAKERVKELVYQNQQILVDQDELRQRVVDLGEQNESLGHAIKDQEWISDQVSEVGVSLIMAKDQGHYNLPLQQNARRTDTRRQAQNMNSMQSLYKSANQFAAQTPGVSSFAQAVCQAKLVDKFIKMDQQQKKEIKNQNNLVADMAQEVDQLRSNVLKVQNEKESLEQLILEILSFGEQCDKQFDRLQDKFVQYEADEKAEVENNLKVLTKIKKLIPESVKQIIIDVEDHDLRDQLLGVLTKMTNRRLQCDQALSLIMDTLVSRVRELSLKDKLYLQTSEDLLAVREKHRETEQLKDQLDQQLSDSQKQYANLNQHFKQAAVSINKIVKIANEHEAELQDKLDTFQTHESDQKIEPTRSADKNTSLKCSLVDPQQLMVDISNLKDWAFDQKHELTRILKDRAKVLELNLKLNSLVQENSLLTILNEKYQLINKKFKEGCNQRGHASPHQSRSRSMERSLASVSSGKRGAHNVAAFERSAKRTSQTRSKSTSNEKRPMQPFVTDMANQEERRGGKKQQRKQNKNQKLHSILHRVQDLKGEISNVDQQQPSQSKIRNTINTPSSYYDQRGSCDLVMQQKAAKVGGHHRDPNKVQMESFDRYDLTNIPYINEQSSHTFLDDNLNYQVVTDQNIRRSINFEDQCKNSASQKQLQQITESFHSSCDGENGPTLQRSLTMDRLNSLENDQIFNQHRNNTIQQDKLHSYRKREITYEEDELQATSQFNPNSLANGQHHNQMPSSRASQTKSALQMHTRRSDESLARRKRRSTRQVRTREKTKKTDQEPLSNPGIIANMMVNSGNNYPRLRRSRGECVTHQPGRETPDMVLPCHPENTMHRSPSQKQSQTSSRSSTTRSLENNGNLLNRTDALAVEAQSSCQTNPLRVQHKIQYHQIEGQDFIEDQQHQQQIISTFGPPDTEGSPIELQRFNSNFARNQSEHHPILNSIAQKNSENYYYQELPQQQHNRNYSGSGKPNNNFINNQENQHNEIMIVQQNNQYDQLADQYFYTPNQSNQNLQDDEQSPSEHMGLMPSKLDSLHNSSQGKSNRKSKFYQSMPRMSTGKKAQEENQYVCLRKRSQNMSQDNIDFQEQDQNANEINLHYENREKINQVNELLHKQNYLLQQQMNDAVNRIDGQRQLPISKSTRRHDKALRQVGTMHPNNINTNRQSDLALWKEYKKQKSQTLGHSRLNKKHNNLDSSSTMAGTNYGTFAFPSSQVQLLQFNNEPMQIYQNNFSHSSIPEQEQYQQVNYHNQSIPQDLNKIISDESIGYMPIRHPDMMPSIMENE